MKRESIDKLLAFDIKYILCYNFVKKGGIYMFDLYNLLKESDINLVLAVLAIIVIIWFYNELRKAFYETEKSYTERYDKALEAYGEIKELIYKTINLKDNKIENISKEINFSKLYSFAPKLILKKIDELREEKSNNKLMELIKCIDDEIYRIKALQSDSVSNSNSGSFVDVILQFFVRTKMKSFCQPFILFLVSVLSMGSFYQNKFNTLPLYVKIQAISITLEALTILFVLLIFGEKLVRSLFVRSFKNWVILFIFIVIPTILSFINPKVFAIFSFIVTWIYIIFLSRKAFRINHTINAENNSSVVVK